MMILCPCCSNLSYETCCEPYLKGATLPPTPESLMRSRYTAYTLANIPYIQKTMRGKPLIGFNPLEAERWAKNVTWTGLNVLKTAFKTPLKGQVEFIAHYSENGQAQSIHEVSDFTCDQGVWFYVDGTHTAAQQPSRNGLCPCGSQKKFKRCCGG